MNEPSKAESARVYAIDEAEREAQALSSQVLDAIALKGKTSDLPPSVSRCDEDPDHLYKVRHPWSLWDVPEADMEKSMEQLKEALSKRGWEVVEYGRGKSSAGYLELTANSAKAQFSVNVTFMDKRKVDAKSNKFRNPSGIVVDLVSACFRVPDGKTVD
ncbi:hypothetical protein [Streptomyces luteireticuli]|uniref:Uncharacterized protein n=1 Tax=Streptomyces luteireticuli TaxID=173858 RepID=A0ABN0Z3P0_9ACTN